MKLRRLVIAAALSLPSLSWAGPSAASGPITVDSTTFVAGSSVMGTDGGVYSDTLPPVASTTTAAFRMTKYRAQHVNLRDNTGTEIGTQSNPLYTTASSTISIANVTVNNSSFSVTGSTVNIAGTVPVSVAGTVNVAITGSPTVHVSSANVTGSTVTITNTGFAVTNTPSVTVGTALPAGTNNIGTVTGSSITIPGTVNTRQVNVSTVIVSAMPAVTLNVSTVTITNSSFSIVDPRFVIVRFGAGHTGAAPLTPIRREGRRCPRGSCACSLQRPPRGPGTGRRGS